MYTLKGTHIISWKTQICLFFSEAFSIYIYIYINYIYTYIYVCVRVFFCPYISSHTFKVAIYLYVYKLTK